MNSLIVEKDVIRGGIKTTYYAVATSQPHRLTTVASLAYEAYITPWTTDRQDAEIAQRIIEESTT